MSSELPFVSCLCPTYRRPQMMANTIPCFITQDYPADRRELIILDDACELQNETGDGDRKSTRLNSSHSQQSRMPSSA